MSYSHSDVAHIWANRSKERVKGKNMFFEGDTIYSWGPHFRIAKHITNARGERAVLFTSRSYSQSTGQHKSEVRSAASHLTIFMVNDEHWGNHELARQEFQTRYDDAVQAARRASVYKDFNWRQAKATVVEANRYANFFDLEWRLECPATLDEAIGEVKERTAEEAAREAERRRLEREREAEQKRQREARAMSDLTNWREGKRDAPVHDAPVIAMRVKGSRVETSMGAEFPVAHAKRAFKVIRKVKQAGDTYYRGSGPEIRLGNFTVDRIDPNGDVHAGCHYVKWDEIERIAGQLGLLENVG